MQKTFFTLLFILWILQVTEIQAQDTPEPPPPPIEFHGNPSGSQGGHNKSPLKPPTMFLDNHTVYVQEPFSFNLFIYGQDDDLFENPLYSASIYDSVSCFVLPINLQGNYLMVINYNGITLYAEIYLD